jgi:hypothetical protein
MSKEQAVRITAQLYEVRETVRRIYGARAMEVMKPYMDLLRQVHKAKGIPIINLGLQMAEDLDRRNMNPMVLLAAMVELIDPTKETKV